MPELMEKSIDYWKGYRAAMGHVVRTINEDLKTIKKRDITPNSPSQIHSGGRRRALQKLHSKFKHYRTMAHEHIKKDKCLN